MPKENKTECWVRYRKRFFGVATIYILPKSRIRKIQSQEFGSERNRVSTPHQKRLNNRFSYSSYSDQIYTESRLIFNQSIVWVHQSIWNSTNI